MDNNDISVQGLSVVLPVYNEAGVIEGVIRSFYARVVKAVPLDVEFIVAEDGSNDGTKEILERLNREIPFILISGAKRKGYTISFKDALRHAGKELVFFSDSDGQHLPDDFFNLYKEIGEGVDIVSGRKINRKDPFHRVFISLVYNFLVRLFFGIRMYDIDSGFKLMKRAVVQSVLDDVGILPQCVMSEFIIRAHLKGFKIKEVPVRHLSRKKGGSAIFTAFKLPSIIFGVFMGLIQLKVGGYLKR